MDALKIEKLTVGYGRRVVAEELTATLPSGCLTALIGRNGVGKSTLLRTLAGFQPPLAGTLCASTDFTSLPLREGRGGSSIAVVLTERPDVTNLTVREVVGLGRSPYTGFWGFLSKNDRFIVAETIREVGIEDLSDRMMQTLSDGERQKVMIAKALAQQTPVVILDEPTAFLDYPSKVEMMALLQELAHKQDKAVLLSTHDMELAVRYADQLWLMRREKPSLVTGPTAEIVESGRLEELQFTVTTP